MEGDITVNNNEQWNHTFDPPPQGWDIGRYRIVIDGSGGPGGTSDPFYINDI